MAGAGADRDLLFGLLALQNGMVNRDQLVAAFGTWTASTRPMPDLLVAAGALTPRRRAVLEALVAEHLAAHGGDPRSSLAALELSPTTRDGLARAAGPDIEPSLARVGTARYGELGSTVHDDRWRRARAAPSSTPRRDAGGPPADPGRPGDGDRGVRAEVGRLPGDDARADADAGGFLDAPAAPLDGDPAEVGRGDCDDTADYPAGAGQRFRILRPLARGGLGQVFVALDTELNRQVALKQISDRHADDPDSRRRFLIEGEITGGLEHPGIVPVYSLGTDDDGHPYYAMRLIKGDSLRQAIERFHADPDVKADRGRRSLELRNLLRRLVDACNAIDYAHSRGVLHRDIKPGNIVVGKYGETLVVDWGLAKPLGRSAPGSDAGERTLIPSAADGAATLPGSTLGTPAYMSPEQAAGELDRLGPRSDVYSLGATLYCLLTGRAPFTGDPPAVLRDVELGRFPAPGRLDPSIDQALEAVCLKAMAHRPDDRYASCRAFADDVERWAADEPVTAYREPPGLRALRWARRNRSPVTLAAVALAVTVVGLTALLVGLAFNDRVVESVALRHAAEQAEWLKGVSSLYSEVADRARSASLDISRTHIDLTGSSPVPPNILIELGRRMQQAHPAAVGPDAMPGRNSVQLRLYSDHPFRRRDDSPPTSEFGKRALAICRIPSRRGQPFYHFEKTDGGARILRYAVPLIMEGRCLNCHNDPRLYELGDYRKTDWRVGDIRGILEVDTSVEYEEEQTRTAIRSLYWTVFGTGAIVLILFWAGLRWGGRRHA